MNAGIPARMSSVPYTAFLGFETMELITTKIAAATNSGFELKGFAGAEFFFNGLESLGFSVETGFALVSLADGINFFTLGGSMIHAGIHFYF